MNRHVLLMAMLTGLFAVRVAGGETSVLTRAALSVASAARDFLIAQEGAFGTHLLEHDVVDPPIMFGAGGTLDARSLPQGTGLGLSAVLTNQ